MAIRLLLAALLALPWLAAPSLAQSYKYKPRVNVQAPTRLDWSYAVAQVSRPETPPEWVSHVYESNTQTYEWYGPKPVKSQKNKDSPARPLIIHVSPRGRATGWKHWEAVCRQGNYLFAGPHGADKGSKDSFRIRVVLDVLDDVRRRHNIDPDRTYIVGYYGGARIATKIAFHLPEYFGGLIAIADGVSPPELAWQQARIRERLKVAFLVGTKDMRGVGNQRAGLTQAFQQDAARARIESRLGRYTGPVTNMAPPKLLKESIKWLEEDATKRREIARDYPSTSLSEAVSRDDHAKMVFEDAKRDLQQDSTTYHGMQRLEHLCQRWPELEIADEAQQLLNSSQTRQGPWQEARQADAQRRLQSQLGKLRPMQEVDPPRTTTRLPRKWAHVGAWIKQEYDPKSSDEAEYDERTLLVIKRLGSRVQLDQYDRVKMLNLSGTRVTSKQFKHLKQQLSGMKELRSLDLSSTVMKESTLSHLADLKSLHAINLSDTELSNRSAQHLSELNQLRFLSLANTPITSETIARYLTLKELRCLNLGGTNVDDNIRPSLAQSPDLEVLSLASTRISPSCDLSALQSLVFLDLTNTRTDDRVIETLTKLPNIETLILNYCKITDETANHLVKIPKLQELSLVGTAVGDEGIRKLAKIKSLVRLNVRSTRATTTGLTTLSKTRPALQVKSEDNRFHDIESQRRKILSRHPHSGEAN